MADTQQVSNWNPLDYLSSEELARLDERFDHALQDARCLVFWTGLSLELAQQWAQPLGLQTLTMTMGPLYSARGVGSARHGKSLKGWSKYMKGASGRFAEYGCRNNRRVIVLTKPPPNIYSTREKSNYQHLEEPILKGVFGGPGTTRIDYVHPTVTGAASFQYQTWPLDKSSEWDIFRQTLVTQGPFSSGISDGSARMVALVEKARICEIVIEIMQGGRDQQEQMKIAEREKKVKDKHQVKDKQQAQERKKANRERANLEHRLAKEKKEANRKKSELERQLAQKRKEANRKKVELEQRQARGRKEAKREAADLQQRMAEKEKEAKRKKAELKQQEVERKKVAKQKEAETKQRKAKGKKNAN